jgi:hypothetical protein
MQFGFLSRIGLLTLVYRSYGDSGDVQEYATPNKFTIIRIYCNIIEFFNNRHPLVGNGTVNTLLRHKTSEPLLGRQRVKYGHYYRGTQNQE